MALNANTAIYDRAIDRAAMLRLYERRVTGKVSLVIDGHAVRVDKLIRDAERSDTGLIRLREAIDQDLRKTMFEAQAVSKRSLKELAEDQLSYTYDGLHSTFGQVWRVERPPSPVAEEVVLKRPLYKDKTLEAGWRGVGIAEKKRLEAVIRRGIATGLNVNQIADEVRKAAVFKITKFQARALVTTAVTSVHTQVDHEVYMANKGALAGWEYVAVLDARTTPLCAHRDGTVYPVEDTTHLPPAHFNCRSTTVPVFKSWSDMAKLESAAQVRRRNISNLTDKQVAFYDGQTPMRESYDAWLRRQPREVQLRHLGDYQKVDLLASNQLELKGFTNAEGNSIGIRELRKMSGSGLTVPGDTRRFATARAKLDSMQLWATTPDDFINDPKLAQTLKDYYILQAGELDGNLSLINYRGTLIGSKKATKNRVLIAPPREDQMRFNPVTGRYEDVRMYQPNPQILGNNLRLVEESEKLLGRDKEFIKQIVDGLQDRMGINERAVVADNLRIIFGRYRDNGEIWGNFKAVVQGQIKFDIMNVSDAIETQIRKDADVLKRLLQANYIDPVLGPTQLQEIHDSFIDNIVARNKWQDKVAPKVARELRNVFDYKIPPVIHARLSDRELQQFYLRFAHRLSLADLPDRDSFAVALGRDLYNLANLNGTRKKWYELGMRLLESKNVKKFFTIETMGTQKRRMRSRGSGRYFGPYYDTAAYNIRVVDPRIQEYAKLNRLIEVGLRIPFSNPKNQLLVRPGYKTYFVKRGIGFEDTREGILSDMTEFPVEFIDNELAAAMNWAGSSRFKVDEDYYDFMKKLLYFQDDRGKAQFYDDLNEYRKYIKSRGDAYERFKSLEWLREKGTPFSTQQFIDHRGRLYERGFIGPQSGETFRPFLNTATAKSFSEKDFYNFQDQVGAFLGGISDEFEGRFNSLTFTGRQKIAEKWRPQLVELGNHMLTGKPANIRAVLESKIVSMVDGDEQGKLFRLAIETAKLDRHLKGNYKKSALAALTEYKTALAMEQDASASGAQVIALTTRNKQLAQLSNVIPTNQKMRLYDEVATATFNDPRFKLYNERLGLTEKDLRSAAKYSNMVTFYGAGERTAAFQVEKYLAKPLGKQEGLLVVTASERDTVLGEIAARAARYKRWDTDTYDELMALHSNVRDVFNKGLDPGDDLMEQLYFLDPKTKDLVEKLSKNYIGTVTPQDFKAVAEIMSEYMAEKAPILKDYTRFVGRLGEEFLRSAKPKNSDFDWASIAKMQAFGNKQKGYILPDRLSELLGIKAGEPLSQKALKRMGFWKPDGTLSEIIYGVPFPDTRRTGAKYLKFEIEPFGKGFSIEVFQANKLPKSWANIPWINFDGKVLEQHYTQNFQERLIYRDKFGNWSTNILNIPQKTEATWWEQVINKKGKINDIADLAKARTATMVNGNHANDAVIVKRYHLWGKANKIDTATVHDAFFANITDMMKGRQALKEIYAGTLKRSILEEWMDELLARGLPKSIYNEFRKEAIEKGLIPVPGKSVVGGKVLTKEDILEAEDILEELIEDFQEDRGWYGVG